MKEQKKKTLAVKPVKSLPLTEELKAKTKVKAGQSGKLPFQSRVA